MMNSLLCMAAINSKNESYKLAVCEHVHFKTLHLKHDPVNLE